MSSDTHILIQKLMQGSCTEQELEILSRKLQKDDNEILPFLEKNWESAKNSSQNSVHKQKIWNKLNSEFLKENKNKKVFNLRKLPRQLL